MMKKTMKPGDMFNQHKAMAMKKRKNKLAPALSAPHNPGSMPNMGGKMAKDTNPNSLVNYAKAMNTAYKNTKVYGMPGKKKRKVLKLNPKSKGRTPKGAHGRAAVKALGRTKTTGNFAKIEKAKGKGAAIAAYQNALSAHKGKKRNKKLRSADEVVKSEQNASHQFKNKMKCKRHNKMNCKRCKHA